MNRLAPRILAVALLAGLLAGCKPSPVFSEVADARANIEAVREAIKTRDFDAAESALDDIGANLDVIECDLEQCGDNADDANDAYRRP